MPCAMGWIRGGGHVVTANEDHLVRDAVELDRVVVELSQDCARRASGDVSRWICAGRVLIHEPQIDGPTCGRRRSKHTQVTTQLLSTSAVLRASDA